VSAVIPDDAEAIRVAVELVSVEELRDLRDAVAFTDSREWRQLLHGALYRALASR
jgi:hypothetical protein